MVEYADNLSPHPHYKGGIPIDFVLASIQVMSLIQKKKKSTRKMQFILTFLH
jgi:hypothetical protein